MKQNIMENNKTLKTCAQSGCNLRGFWIEEIGGRKVLCFKGKHHGETHIIQLLLPEGVNELEQVQYFDNKTTGEFL